MVRRRPLGGHARPHLLRQGRQLRVRAARRRRHQPEIADTFAERAYPGGLTYSGHPLACASAVASINIFKEEGIIEHARHLGDDVVGPALAEIAERHPSVGEVRGLGVFWAIELVRDRDPRAARALQRAGAGHRADGRARRAGKQRGLWPFTHFNRMHVVPPLTISDDEMREGLAIIDEALTVADEHAAVESGADALVPVVATAGSADGWRDILARRSAQWPLLDDDEREPRRARRRAAAHQALGGGPRVRMTDEVRTLVAAHAALLVLGLDETLYDGVGTIVVRAEVAMRRPTRWPGRPRAWSTDRPGAVDGEAHDAGPDHGQLDAARRRPPTPASAGTSCSTSSATSWTCSTAPSTARRRSSTRPPQRWIDVCTAEYAACGTAGGCCDRTPAPTRASSSPSHRDLLHPAARWRPRSRRCTRSLTARIPPTYNPIAP